MSSTITVSYSELDSYRQCPLKHELGYKERWVGPRESPALSRGTLTHAVLEDHYRAKLVLDAMRSGEDQIPLWIPSSEDDTLDESLEHEYLRLVRKYLSADDEQSELVAWILRGYLEAYGWDEGWKVLAVEHAPVVWLPGPNGGRSRFKLKLKIDLIIGERGTTRMWVVDHKTCRNLPKQKQMDINDQFGLYPWSMKQLGWPIFGQVHNALRTERLKSREMELDERFSRTRMFRTDVELDAVARDAYKTAKLAYGTPLGEAGRSPDEDRCGWRCDYTDACLMGRKMGDDRQVRVFLRSAGFVQDFTRH